MKSINSLADVAMVLASRGAHQYLLVHGLTTDSGALAECIESWIKIKLPEALADAKDALACNMGAVAEQTFAASMIQAGIEAAKEACMPEVKTLEVELTKIN